MPNHDYVPSEDLQFKEFGENFVNVASEKMTELQLSQAQVDQLTTDQTAFDTALDQHLAAQLEAKTATGLKNDNRKLYENNIRNIATFIQGNPAVSNEDKQDLGLPIHDTTPSVVVPVPPADLKAEGTQSGTNLLDWKNGGNKPGTIYVIEKKLKDDPEFSYVDVATATKYKHTGQKPGVFMLYRIKAKRGKLLSEPSNEASVYGSEG